MRPHPLVPSSRVPSSRVPSPRRTLATLAALLISAALSLGFAPLPTSLLLDNDTTVSKLAGEPCGLEKVSTAGAVVSTASTAVTTADPVVSTASTVVHAPSPAAKVSTAGPAAKVPTASPIGLLQTCPGVRPGAIVQSEQGLCTYNFVFQDVDSKDRYIGTAGHCALPGPRTRSGLAPPLEPVERKWMPADPERPVANDVKGNPVGVFVYAVRSEVRDFALIRINEGVDVNPAMCHFGGPTGINNDRGGGTVTLHFYGNGQGVSTLAPGRSALALDMSDPNKVSAYGPAVPGDSGAGVISEDGRAVGNISEVGVGLGPILEGILTIPRIGQQIARAEQVLDVDLELVTAPLNK